VARARRDFHHKTARRLVDEHAGIAVEDLQTADMMQSAPLRRFVNRWIADAGWAQFISILESKAEEAGSLIVKVDPAGTSHACSGCGAVVVKALRERQHRCPCGVELHRDHNAALNIYQRAWAVPVVEAASSRPLKREAAKPAVCHSDVCHSDELLASSSDDYARVAPRA
jgi:putative transposase